MAVCRTMGIQFPGGFEVSLSTVDCFDSVVYVVAVEHDYDEVSEIDFDSEEMGGYKAAELAALACYNIELLALKKLLKNKKD